MLTSRDVRPWPKDLVVWHDGRRQCMSVPFTWLLPKAQRYIDAFRGDWLVGGPAVSLMPDYLERCHVGREYPGILQRINPQATRTTSGCPRGCSFCGVRKIFGEFRQFSDWPDQPIVCDDNLLAAEHKHFERVIDRLVPHGWCDFNQGIDCRLLTPWHVKQIARVKKPIVRLALDSDDLQNQWATALDYLLTAGVAKRNIRSYVLIGNGSVTSCWRRCEFVENTGVKALPMWMHSLTAMRHNEVTPMQELNSWTRDEQRKIMRYYYRHTGAKQ